MQIRDSLNNLNETPLHSHGFAEAASTGIGSTNSETFDERKQRERNRLFVPGYKRSLIGHPVAARKYQRPAERATTPPTNQPNRSSPLASQPPTRSFQEPPRREYNPYG